MRRCVAALIVASSFISTCSDPAYASETLKYTNQKAGQSCKSVELGKLVRLPNKNLLKCAIASGSSKAKWQLVSNKSNPPKSVLPRAGLVPTFSSTYSGIQNGFSLWLSNFDSAFTWSCTISIGTCQIDDSGTLQGKNFPAGGTVSIVVITSRSGYFDASADIRLSPKQLSIQPLMKPQTLSSMQNGAVFQIDNFDPNFTWSVSASKGVGNIDTTGVVTISGLKVGEESLVTVTTSATNYFDQSAIFRVQASISFSNVSQRDWQLIAKDPNGAKGQYIVVYGKITQFDAFTGLSTFRADIAGVDLTSSGYWIGGDNSFLLGDPTMLKPFVTGDRFTAKVKILGAYSYTSTANYQVTAVQLQVYEISRI